MIYMDADDSTFLLRVHSVLLLLEGANLRFGLHAVLNAGWISSIYSSRMFRKIDTMDDTPKGGVKVLHSASTI